MCLDFLEIILCVLYRYVDWFFEGKASLCYCKDRGEESAGGNADDEKEDNELSETLYERKNVFRQIGFFGFAGKSKDCKKACRTGGDGGLVTRWTDCGCENCVSWMKSGGGKTLHFVVKEPSRGCGSSLVLLLLLGAAILRYVTQTNTKYFKRNAGLLLVYFVLARIYLDSGLASASSLAKAGCPDSCGDVSIPYPFGIGPNCYFNEGYAVTCNYSDSPPKPLLASIRLELMEVSLIGYVKVKNPIISLNCGIKQSVRGVNLSGSPFFFSTTQNRFTAMGCDNDAALLDQNKSLVGSCWSVCSSSSNATKSGCNGINCCQTSFPSEMNSFVVNFINVLNRNDSQGCRTAFMVDRYWFDQQSLNDVQNQEFVPVILEWTKMSWDTSKNGGKLTFEEACDVDSKTSDSFCSRDGISCWTQIGQDSLCICSLLPRDTSILPEDSSLSPTNSSNIPYVSGGCEDMKKCTRRRSDSCGLYCPYRPGNYSCSIPQLPLVMGKGSRARIILLACGSAIGSLFSLAIVWYLYKLLQEKKAARLKKKYFKRNGGLLLQRQLTLRANNLENIKQFDSKELEKATDNYSESRIIGRGGQGKVYKGMLADGRIVAIKKAATVVVENMINEFINELVILSQINHRNVVKLLGYCLEMKVPILVYEFIPNGTLDQLLRDKSGEFLLTWEMRLRIAMEIADALSYLHSSAPRLIYHRDIKSSNILLDDKYRAKVSDFGISRSVKIDQTHLTTDIQGTYGYFDPEYLRSRKFTDRSDVYSFGVVLVELLTGEKASFHTTEDQSLIAYFLTAMENDCLFEILDKRAPTEGSEEAIRIVADIARRCLSGNAEDRPTMREASKELEGVRQPQGAIEREFIYPPAADPTSTGYLEGIRQRDFTGLRDAAFISAESLDGITEPREAIERDFIGPRDAASSSTRSFLDRIHIDSPSYGIFIF